MKSLEPGNFYLNGVENMTLAAALDQHYVLNPQFTIWSDYKSDIAKKLVRAHDLSHILFGCDTSLLGEMRVQLWAKYGVRKFGFKESLRYAKDKEAKVLLKNPVGYWAMFVFFITHFGEVGKVRARSKVMSKKWLYFEEDTYIQKTVGQIRKDFGIRILSD